MSKSLKTEIIAVGTELLLGQIANTNAQWLSQQLAIHGVNTYFHTVVGDNLERLKNILLQAEVRSDIIIISGGLGPTEDDLTREAFQTLSNFEIVEHEPSMKKIERFFEKQQIVMTPNNRRQARVFKDAHVIENTLGMAPGMIVHWNHKYWIFLPGVPTEMKQMALDEVFPFLVNLNGETVIQSEVLRFIGIGESTLEHDLKQMIQEQVNPTIAPLAHKDGVTIRLTAKADSIEKAKELLTEVKEKILERVGQYYYGEADEKIEEVIQRLLKQQNKWVAAAESLTGGLFTERLISVPGASHVSRGGIVCYDPSVKQNVLGVSKETIIKKGTVSYECALEMAKKVCQLLDADIGISFTGVAGPDSVENQSVGTVFIGLYHKMGESRVEKFVFEGNRRRIRYRAMLKGFELLFAELKSKN